MVAFFSPLREPLSLFRISTSPRSFRKVPHLLLLRQTSPCSSQSFSIIFISLSSSNSREGIVFTLSFLIFESNTLLFSSRKSFTLSAFPSGRTVKYTLALLPSLLSSTLVMLTTPKSVGAFSTTKLAIISFICSPSLSFFLLILYLLQHIFVLFKLFAVEYVRYELVYFLFLEYRTRQQSSRVLVVLYLPEHEKFRKSVLNLSVSVTILAVLQGILFYEKVIFTEFYDVEYSPPSSSYEF
ncbi:putative protein [Aquifex aeolicus VF5]|uniref:Uncharacterized protein aq_106 n=1 Tax=Aquifex aeolicus (strain VF5) TaxID=224324 RepID=Y106_AQUAE|nr:RecName: Full=Uncharacterized protein aq_106 [Aquifex aeolicus VF5]AAC06464.1 putative protein [Aquifex aeolicus VF5]